jgi:putative aldouronate transport system permease protein
MQALRANKPAPAVRVSRTNRRWQSFKLFLFIIPSLALIFLFKYLPLWGWAYAFYNYKPGLDLADCTFVGLDNFKNLFGTPVLRANILRVLRNTFGIQMLHYLFMPLPMIFAVFLSEVRSKKFQKLVQTVTTLPNFISWVIMFSLATCIFNSNGLINSVLVSLGKEPVGNLLQTGENVWLTQTLLSLWKSLGWSSIVYFATIAGVDQQMYEAASLDGANRMQRIWYITLPQLIPTFFVLLIMGIGNFLTSGVDQYLAFSNALNRESIEVLDLYVYNLGIGSGMISLSVAVGVLKSLVAVVLFSMANIASKKIRGTSVF